MSPELSVARGKQISLHYIQFKSNCGFHFVLPSDAVISKFLQVWGFRASDLTLLTVCQRIFPSFWWVPKSKPSETELGGQCKIQTADDCFRVLLLSRTHLQDEKVRSLRFTLPAEQLISEAYRGLLGSPQV